MQYFELCNEDGSGTGIIKERSAVHRDGDLHGGSHVWIVGNRYDDRSFDVLLQKRSDDKDAFPGCFDISCAGHIAAGEDFLCAAVRELDEELNIKSGKSDLLFLFKQLVSWEGSFHGKPFKNREVNFVYLLNRDVTPDDIRYQKSEIQAVIWKNSVAILERLKEHDTNYCIQLYEFEHLIRCMEQI